VRSIREEDTTTMLCTECGGVVVTRIVADIRPDQGRVWFWALRCSCCERLVDAGLKPDRHSCASTGETPLRRFPFPS
jgi:rRNA maturation endonuclease Nob1